MCHTLQLAFIVPEDHSIRAEEGGRCLEGQRRVKLRLDDGPSTINQEEDEQSRDLQDRSKSLHGLLDVKYNAYGVHTVNLQGARIRHLKAQCQTKLNC